MSERSSWGPVALVVALIAAAGGLWWAFGGGEDRTKLEGRENGAADAGTTEARRERPGDGVENEGLAREAGEEPVEAEASSAVRGIVVDGPRGVELAGIRLRARPLEGGPERTTTSGEGGAFLLALPPGNWELRAIGDRVASEPRRIAALSEDEVRDVGTVLLEPASRIAGRVVDVRLRPLGGIRIDLHRGASLQQQGSGLDMFRYIEDLLDPPPPVASAVSDDDGGFAFDLVMNGEYALAASGEGWQRTLSGRLRVDDRIGEVRHDFVMAPGLSLRGRCVDEAGAPVEGVRLIAFSDSSGFRGPGSTRSFRSDASGGFVMDGLDAVEYQVIARHPRYAPVGETKGRPGEDLVVRLDRGSRIFGVVRDADGGEPVPGVTVMAFCDERPAFLDCRTDAEGSYELANVPDRAGLMLFLRSDRYFLKSKTGPEMEMLGMGAQVRIPRTEQPRGSLRRDLTVMRGGAVEGRVLDGETGEPVAGAEVRVFGLGGPIGTPGGGAAPARSGPDGRYRLVNAAPGPVTVMASHPDYAPPGMEELQPIFMGMERGGTDTRPKVASGETLTGIDVTIRRGIVVRGRVVDEEGEPVARARVTVSGAGGLGMAMIGGGAPARDGITDAEGRFEIRGVAPSASRGEEAERNPFAGAMNSKLVARHPAYAGGGSVDLETPGGRAPEGLEIVLRRGASLRGVLLDETGRPAGDRVLRFEFENEAAEGGSLLEAIMETGMDSRRVTTDAEGRFALVSVPHGEVEASLGSDQSGVLDAETARFVLRPGEAKEVELRLVPTASVSGVVVDEEGRALRGTVLAMPSKLGDASQPRWWDSTGREDGTFVIEGLPLDGEVDLTVYVSDRTHERSHEPLRVEGVRPGTTGLRLVVKRKKGD